MQVRNNATYVDGWKAGLAFAKNVESKAFTEGYKKGFSDGSKGLNPICLDGLKVGDVVTLVTECDNEEYVVTAIFKNSDKCIEVLSIEDGLSETVYVDDVKKTGRHIMLDFLKNYYDEGYQE